MICLFGFSFFDFWHKKPAAIYYTETVLTIYLKLIIILQYVLDIFDRSVLSMINLTTF